MKKISIIVLIMIMFYVVANMVWLKVVNNNIDEYLDKDNVSRELISYEGKKTNLEYYIITCNYKGVEKKLNQGEKVNQIFKKSGKTPLMIAATLPNFKDAIKMSQILIKEGADVNKKDIYGANVLFYVGYYDYEKRTFQAIRIEVNNELGVITKMIDDAVSIMNEGGRVCIITFHSLEDRIVKNEFRDLALDCVCPSHLPICQCDKESLVKVITRKPILPSKEEIEENPRSRSAKLRVAERI